MSRQAKSQKHGKVKEFDEERGLGIVEAEGSEWRFHCTQIADGSRTIAVGTAVAFDVAAGMPGHWEAVAVQKIDKL